MWLVGFLCSTFEYSNIHFHKLFSNHFHPAFTSRIRILPIPYPIRRILSEVFYPKNSIPIRSSISFRFYILPPIPIDLQFSTQIIYSLLSFHIHYSNPHLHSPTPLNPSQLFTLDPISFSSPPSHSFSPFLLSSILLSPEESRWRQILI